jgi:hypothetical protein
MDALQRLLAFPLSVAERKGKYYGTDVIDATGHTVATFWHADGEPSAREKALFGDWTPQRWREYVSDAHWESDVAYRAAEELASLLNAHALTAVAR